MTSLMDFLPYGILMLGLFFGLWMQYSSVGVGNKNTGIVVMLYAGFVTMAIIANRICILLAKMSH